MRSNVERIGRSRSTSEELILAGPTRSPNGRWELTSHAMDASVQAATFVGASPIDAAPARSASSSSAMLPIRPPVDRGTRARDRGETTEADRNPSSSGDTRRPSRVPSASRMPSRVTSSRGVTAESHRPYVGVGVESFVKVRPVSFVKECGEDAYARVALRVGGEASSVSSMRGASSGCRKYFLRTMRVMQNPP